ncbi:chromosome partitioning protein ParA [Altericroceibacterium spongiae]|uniref:Iron-sulfur cluster carrier protein n=1 Tax=Altericroceibacterium spongiae TaxID=2320269 RepID=A0A420EQ26_9SPHN|nr:Mrp/NBP35 family ATP-binding protein [Altericroceibacterium spongiae]RKF22795.1 chromosome partitioning protein ParA [Altericroceibacterium spongiae]
MTIENAIKNELPDNIGARVQSVRLNDGIATLVVDASGLARSDAAALEERIRQTLTTIEGVRDVRVAMMADKVKRRLVAVGSGKGGVGKSTLTANLAVALARAGHKVGVVDADIYGPSQPTLLDPANQKPQARDKQLIPVESEFGVKLLSTGQLIEPGKAIAWRGPMTGGALTQMMEADWGDTEIILIDLPPGTGDIQLTMIQKFKPDGAMVVSTPQDLSLIDAARALDLFRQAHVPVIGIVENMAGYMCPHCGEISDPFGSGGAEAAALQLGENFLGRIPLAMEIRVASDTGQPPAANNTPQGQAFAGIAHKLSDWLTSKGQPG